MHRRTTILAVVASTLLLMGLSAGQALAAGDDDIPGVPIPASPVQGYLASGSDYADVYSIPMRSGDHLTATLNAVSTLPHSWMNLFAPDAMSIFNTTFVAQGSSAYPQTLVYNAPSTGTYYLAVRTYKNADMEGVLEYGSYSFAWMCQSPTQTALTSRSKKVRRGSSSSVAGFVKYDTDSSAVVGQAVTLQKSATGGAWNKAAVVKTDAAGHFSFTVKPRRTTYYRVISPQTGSLLQSVSVRLKYKVR